MRIINRLMHAYKSNGLVEVLRKGIYYFYYRFRNALTYRKVMKSKQVFGLNTNARKGPKIIVSLTSFPKRLPYIGMCLKSLLLQDYQPDRIIVYLGSDTKQVDLPEEIASYKEYGVEFRFDNNLNLRSHKKYFYAMQEFPDDLVITVDDDLIYPDDMISTLVKTHLRYPNAICARRVHLMRQDKEGKIVQYNHWFHQVRKYKAPSFALFPTTGAGTLFPPHCLDERAFDVISIKELCMNADDIWIKCMATLAETPCVWVPNNEVSLRGIPNPNEVSLYVSNVFQSGNDKYLSNLIKHYSIDEDRFFAQ